MIAKTSCQHCGVHIEFDAENAGEFVPCPSCGKHTRLLLATQKSVKTQPSKPKKWGISQWFTLVLVVIGVGALIYLAHAIADLEAVQKVVGSGIMAIIAGVVAVFSFVLAVLWTIFPLFVYFDLKAMRKLLEQIRDK